MVNVDWVNVYEAQIAVAHVLQLSVDDGGAQGQQQSQTELELDQSPTHRCPH